jgi:ergothioneine biosynthesis protein EgtB
LSEHDAPAIARRYSTVRRRSLQLAEPLSDEDCGAQSMPDASPVKWHLAHTTWFFETFVLESNEPRFAPFHQAFRVLFNSYYNGIGDKHPRHQRGLLTRPPMAQVRAYRANVDARVAALLAQRPDLAGLVELGLQHEQQHQELILTDVKHLLAQSALAPAYLELALAATPATPLGWTAHAGGVVAIGHDGAGFCFDNELPRHRQVVEPFELADRLVNNGEYLAFIEAGGYRDPSLWLSEGWDWVRSQAVGHPLYWQANGGGQQGAGTVWGEFTLAGMQALHPSRPVTHISLYEADAFARWSGARLPTEAEWETAAAGHAIDTGELHPQAGGSGLFGQCWQWTSSSYAPYPGFATAPGALGEYNGKFMLNQYVLRGSSCATPSGHARASYRNFFPAHARWQFSGIRLAR